MAGSTDKNSIAMEARKAAGAKLFSPSAARNAVPIRDVLAPRLPEEAQVLEIGCGTGEHAETVCRARPDLTWLPSDPDPASRDSATARSLDIEGLQPAREIDVSVKSWEADLPRMDAIVCSNVIHIAPWAVAEGLATGAEQLIRTGGMLFLYGPFLTGNDTAPSNIAFDHSLRDRNPHWGVRPLDAVIALFARHKLSHIETIPMPANNLSLIFKLETQ